MRRVSLLVVVPVLALVGCPEDRAGGGGEGEGEGDGESQRVDIGCDADDACDDGLVCDLRAATCVAGFDCSVNTTICGFCGDPGVECGFDVDDGAGAFCDVDHGAVCRRAKGACAPCSEDVECGEGPTGLPSVCVDGFCAPGCGPCPAGFSCAAEGGCVPVASAGSCDGALSCADGTTCPDGLTCSELGICLALCGSDADCAVGDICATEPPLASTCVQGCPLGQTVLQDGVQKICHGDGRFGDPCPIPGDTAGCPAGTVCRDDGACALAGCQSDLECPLLRTYCDVASASCVAGCNDPSDCAAFERCEDNQCVPQGCRGKDSSCDAGEFCCGKELYETGNCVDRGGATIDDGRCFLAPDPFCRRCENDDDCADIDAFGFPSYCYELQRQDSSGNDVSLGKFCSTGCRSNDDCPRGLRCLHDLPTPDGGTTSGCLEALCAGYP